LPDAVAASVVPSLLGRCSVSPRKVRRYPKRSKLRSTTARCRPSLLGRMFRFAAKCPALPQAQQAALSTTAICCRAELCSAGCSVSPRNVRRYLKRSKLRSATV
jgi:hypothetical protein